MSIYIYEIEVDMPKILIIEDDVAISDLIKMNLEMYGFETLQAFDGLSGLDQMENEPDLVVLDLMLPKMNGYEVLQQVKGNCIPVIMLTSQSSLSSKIKGFNLGADDYLTKPFESLELISRINAVLRRHEPIHAQIESYAFENIKMYVDKREVLKDECRVDLTHKEFELLHYLILNRGIALSREKLLKEIWSYDYKGNSRTVDMHVQKLRSKLETDMIETVYKYGYRFDG